MLKLEISLIAYYCFI